MFKRVLFPTDGSPAALSAAKALAEHAARTSETTVTVLVAIHMLDPEQTDMDEEMVQARNARAKQMAEQAAQDACAVFAQRGIGAVAKIISGDPVSAAIAREADTGNYDLIAMGSRDMSLQKSDLQYLGSVTEHVIRRVSIPVLVVPVSPAKD